MSDDDLDLLLADLNNNVPPMTDTAFRSGRTLLTSTLSSPETYEVPLAPTGTGPAPRQGRAGPSRRVVVQLVAVVAAVVAVGVGTLVLPGDDSIEVSSPAQLAAWATGLGDNPSELAPGQYLYVQAHHRIVTTYQDSKLALEVDSNEDSETWAPSRDFKDPWRYKLGENTRRLVSGTPEQQQAADPSWTAPTRGYDVMSVCGQPDLPSTEKPPPGKEIPGDPPDVMCPAHERTYPPTQDFYREMVEHPDRLDKLLHETLLEKAHGLFAVNAPKDYLATLFKSISGLPGIAVVDTATTQDGRTGIGIIYKNDKLSVQWVADRDTGQILENKQISGDDHFEVMTYRYGVTDDIHNPPGK